MNKLISLSMLMLLQCTAFAQTNFSGVISANTTWTKANSPYVIVDDVLVESGVTLTIQPGVQVKFNDKVNFLIEGSINAYGDATGAVMFMKAPPPQWTKTSWVGLRFKKGTAPQTGTFKNCVFNNPEATAIQSDDHITLNIDSCTRPSIDAKNSDITLMHSSPEALYLQNCNTTIANNEFYNDQMALEMDGGIAVIQGNYFSRKRVEIEGSVVEFKDNAFYGTIHFDGYAEMNIADNLFSSDEAAILCHDDTHPSTRIENNLFQACKTGIHIFKLRGTIEKNSFKHNDVGVEFFRWDTASHFVNNCLDSNEMNIGNEAIDDIFIPGNWWGSSDSATIQQKQFDFYDNPTRGKIHFIPAATQAPSSCKASNIPGGSSVGIQGMGLRMQEISIGPNPFRTSFSVKLNNKQAEKISVYNVMGKKVADMVLVGKSEVSIDLSQQPAGLYTYQVLCSDNTSFSGKLVKE